MNPGFKATDQSLMGHRGFAMNFQNGYSVSVQWGWMNYCENRKDLRSHQERLDSSLSSKNAEVMIAWKGEALSEKRFPQLIGSWRYSFDESGIASDLTADSVAKFLADVAYLTEEPI